MIKKTQEVEKTVNLTKVDHTKVDLKNLLVAKMPAMFDRNPDITGNLDKFADEIINIIK